MRHLVYNDRYSVVPINSSPLTVTLYSSVRTTFVHNYSKYSVSFISLQRSSTVYFLRVKNYPFFSFYLLLSLLFLPYTDILYSHPLLKIRLPLLSSQKSLFVFTKSLDKAFPVASQRGGGGIWACKLNLTLGTTRWKSCSSMLRPYSTPKEIPLYSFLLQAKWAKCGQK